MRVNVSATAHPLEAAVHTPDTAIRDHDGASSSHALNRVALMGDPFYLICSCFRCLGLCKRRWKLRTFPRWK